MSKKLIISTMEEILDSLESTAGGYFMYDKKMELFLNYSSLQELETALIIYQDLPVSVEGCQEERHEVVAEAMADLTFSYPTSEALVEYLTERALA